MLGGISRSHGRCPFSVILFHSDGFQPRLNYLQILLLPSKQRDFPVGCFYPELFHKRFVLSSFSLPKVLLYVCVCVYVTF